MDTSNTHTVKIYEDPRVVDHGTLEDITAACAGGSGGDMYTAGGVAAFGVSNPAYSCKSK
jgi:hypothetical protein